VIGTFKYNNTNGVCNGKITVSADGVGTLNLPNNVTFTNVLRLRSVEQITATVGFLPAGTIRQSIYSFYAPGKKYPVISVQYQNYQLLVGTPTITALAYGEFQYFTAPPPGAGFYDLAKDDQIHVYPNPFTGQLKLDVRAGSEPRSLSVFNLQGEMLLQAGTIEELALEKLVSGVYVLEIRNETKSHFQKIVRE
jgi:hypothetical protein